MRLKLLFITVALFVVFGKSYGQTYNQITLSSELTNGDYLIVGDGTTNDGIMLNTITPATPYINYSTVTNPGDTILTGFTSANVFTINVDGGNITIFNSSVGYVSWGRDGNKGNSATFFNGTAAATEQWTPTVASGLWTLANVDKTTRELQWNNANPRFAAYTNAQVKLKLYKLVQPFYRSRASGSWATASNWESSADNITWATATLAPTSTANSITIRNPHTITISSAVTADQTIVETGATLALNGVNLNLNDGVGTDLTINSGGTFDNGGENQIINGGGSPSIIISGTFLTRDVQGFVGLNTAIPGITPTLNSGSTIEYGLAGNQAVQGSTAPTYQNISFSGGGTKTLASTNSVVGTISVLGTTIFDAGNSAFGSGTSNVTMTGASVYKLSGTTASKPESGGTYTLDPLSTFEFTGSANTEIRVSSPVINYANIIISGKVRNPATVTGIKFQSGRTFTVKNGGIFRLNNTAGFTGSTTTAINNTNPPTITLETGSRIEFAGNQVLPATQTITPFSGYSDVGISGTGTKTLANTTEVYVGRDLLLFPETNPANTGYLQIDSNQLLTVERNILNTSTKELVVKNNGNLVQVTNVDNATTNANTGNIKMTRISRDMQNAYDYVYWGSPVKENVISQIPASYDDTYQWDLNGGIDGSWNALAAIVPGRGFITRVKQGGTGATSFDFTGTPNNGTVNVFADGYTDTSADVTGNTILLANPYPSAIDATAFVDSNAILDGNLYFWTSSTKYEGGEYVFEDYATWNKSGGTATAPPPSNPLENLKPSGKIAAGQGFFADFTGDGNVTFNNTMRLRTTTDNSQFFKNSKPNKSTVEKSRVWLNLSNDKNAFRQMLVAYISDATNGFDRSYDGETFTYNEINIYSILEDKTLVIQGRALPLEDTDLIPLGVTITNAGDYKISIDEVDGLMTDKPIFIEDKVANVVHNLKNAPYNFNISSGTFNDRFVLRYTDKTLGSNDLESLENQVIVSKKNKQIKVNSAVETIDKVLVYDLLGREIFKNEKVNSHELSIPNLYSSYQTVLVKVTLQNGYIITKKVIY